MTLNVSLTDKTKTLQKKGCTQQSHTIPKNENTKITTSLIY